MSHFDAIEDPRDRIEGTIKVGMRFIGHVGVEVALTSTRRLDIANDRLAYQSRSRNFSTFSGYWFS